MFKYVGHKVTSLKRDLSTAQLKKADKNVCSSAI